VEIGHDDIPQMAVFQLTPETFFPFEYPLFLYSQNPFLSAQMGFPEFLPAGFIPGGFKYPEMLLNPPIPASFPGEFPDGKRFRIIIRRSLSVHVADPVRGPDFPRGFPPFRPTGVSIDNNAVRIAENDVGTVSPEFDIQEQYFFAPLK
jgi:hypothetical protein